MCCYVSMTYGHSLRQYHSHLDNVFDESLSVDQSKLNTVLPQSTPLALNIGLPYFIVYAVHHT